MERNAAPGKAHVPGEIVRDLVRLVEEGWAGLETAERPGFVVPATSVHDRFRAALIAALLGVPTSDEHRPAAVYAACTLLRSAGEEDDAWYRLACDGLGECPPGSRARIEFLKLVIPGRRDEDWDAVIDGAREILEREPTNPRAYEFLLDGLFRQGRHGEALEVYAEANARAWRGVQFQLNRPLVLSASVARRLADLRRNGGSCASGAAPAAAASIMDFAAFGSARFNFYALGDVAAIADEDAPQDRAYVRLTAPFGKDRNHLAGIGVADLVFSWEPAPLAVSSKWTPSVLRTLRPLDLRNARLELRYRPVGVNEKGFRAYVAVTSLTHGAGDGGAVTNAPWVFTAESVPMTADGWTTAVVELSADPGDWTFAGNNPDEQPHAGRYAYADLETTLRANTGNIVFWFLSGDERDTPEGAIDLAWVRLSYANESVLAPASGAVLKRWPAGAPSDPAVLTDGRIGDPAAYWVSSDGATAVQAFEWQLAGETPIHEVRLYQHPLAPARDVVLKASADGQTYGVVDVVRMPEAGIVHRGRGDMERVRVEPAVTARFFRLEIQPSGDGEPCGLDAVEVFAPRA